MNKSTLVTSLCALVCVASFGLSAGEAATEELFGERIYFPLGDKFEKGNYMDYFCAAWTGELLRNMKGHQGYCARVKYAGTRPIRCEAGKKYTLTFKAYNLGMEKGHLNPENKTVFPGITFIDGTKRLKTEKDWWKRVKMPEGWKAEGQLTETPPPAEWKDYAVTFTVPEGADCVSLGFASIWQKKNQWGPYYVADIDMKEVK